MSAAQTSLFPFPIRSRCLLCNDTGWRYVTSESQRDPRVTRCECKRRRQVTPERPRRTRRNAQFLDHKAAAAGER